jgi:hypothetical protein
MEYDGKKCVIFSDFLWTLLVHVHGMWTMSSCTKNTFPKQSYLIIDNSTIKHKKPGTFIQQEEKDSSEQSQYNSASYRNNQRSENQAHSSNKKQKTATNSSSTIHLRLDQWISSSDY